MICRETDGEDDALKYLPVWALRQREASPASDSMVGRAHDGVRPATSDVWTWAGEWYPQASTARGGLQ